MIVISLVLGFITNIIFALQLAGVGASVLGILLWAQQDSRRYFILNIFSIVALVGWMFFSQGIAGIPDSITRLGGMILLCLTIDFTLRVLGLRTKVIAKSTEFTESDA
jgi:hypothetical protein